jgi:hypothetical protein
MSRRVVGVVEITQHGRMIQGRDQEIAELAERMGADGAVLVIADQDANVGLVLMHVEMIEPEPCHAFAQLIRRIERAQDAAGRCLLGPIVHGLLVDLLRRLLLVGIGDLIGAPGLLVECHQDVERKLVDIRHGLDLRSNSLRQCTFGSRMQLLLEPPFGADRLQMRGTRRSYPPGQPIEQNHVAGI